MSSTTSWRSAAAIVWSSSCSSAQIFADAHGWWMNGSPERRTWPVVRGRRELEGAGDQLLVDVGVVRLDVRDQLVDEVLVVPLNVNDSHHFQCTGLPSGRNSPEGLRVATGNDAAHAQTTQTDEESHASSPG